MEERMAGRIVWAYGVVICGYQLLCPAQRLLAAAMPTAITVDNETLYHQAPENASLATGAISVNNETVYDQTQGNSSLNLEAITPNNETVYDEIQRNASLASGVIWQITETAGNESTEDPGGILFRGGWTSKTQNSNLYLETDEGWLNSGIISQDASIPYRGAAVSNRLGNGTEEWKDLLVKPEAHAQGKRGRVSKVLFNERRDIPFQFHWQVNPKRFYNSSEAP
ncbi:unnamed protein product [Nezara viridula]|uniref:Uncharacterized protein n=1 Tax=Nezara viridula TaxID=85310 RepID=A0A9P0MWQ7_NEZVI|nr:unnamed protein product [Nezara viridula]